MEKKRRLTAVASAGLDTERPRVRRSGRGSVEPRRQVAEMSDREAIRQLPIAHAYCARARDVEGIVALYAKDAAFEVPGSSSWPLIHGHYFEMRGCDRAEGFVYIEFRMGEEGHEASHVACYRDAYIKEEGVWKFRSRRLCTVPVPGPASDTA